VAADELKALMRRSDLKGALQTAAHVGYFFATGAIAYLIFLQIDAGSWYWSVPALALALFAHGTIGPFMGLIAIHELQHRTVFRRRWLNELFEKVYAFISWSDYIWYQQSHAIHHRATCHADIDGEVVLPVRFSLKPRAWLRLLVWDPADTWQRLTTTWRHARGEIRGDWYHHVLPETDAVLRRRHRNWARFLLAGHGVLALVFVATGHWFLIVVFTLGTQYCAWLGFLCGATQHYGLNPNIPDFRYNTRTFTCSPVPAFFYWNMQYHLEHHMYPAVPFFNMPRLRSLIEHDLPPAPHGLLATWREMLAIRRRALADPDYRFIPAVPGSVPDALPATTQQELQHG
jgi:fatty acid desaturase